MKKFRGRVKIGGNFKPFSILYAGDTDCDRAASYLLGVLCSLDAVVTYVPSCEKMNIDQDFTSYDLVILSDYPRAMAQDQVWKELALWVHRGGKLLMIGGWESFHGKNGEYSASALEAALPVELASADDRRNPWQGLVLQHVPSAGVFSELDWSRPPLIAGYNSFTPRKKASIILEGKALMIDANLNTNFGASVPLGVSHQYGKGHSTALAFDLAPHWIAGAVDWGTERRELVLPQARRIRGSRLHGTCPEKGSVRVEVGREYIGFVVALINHARGLS